MNVSPRGAQRAPSGKRFVQDVEVDGGWLPERV
jgi:hypothetical protein